ncbi:DNAJ protein JJJ1 homolog, partial [Syzygium oleosum]|uniref:DNAJ protein JJJ1 homolog n=1 Tax=Syzygium oleosum TaxID=219896 RepID=UPI0024BB281E
AKHRRRRIPLANFRRARPPAAAAMASEKRCHYEVLGLSRDCTADEIRAAYRKLALQRHPDKLVQSGGLSPEDATAQFQELAHAYEVLSDPKERAWYDSHRSQILFSDRGGGSAASSPVPDLFAYFSNTVFSGYSDSGKGFYKVYADVLDRIYANEIGFARKMGLGLDSVREAPLMGNLESPYAQVTAFYNYWLGFCTVMDFMWADMYDAAAGVNRKSRRVMEEENKKLRKKARREFNETVRGLAEFVKKRDKRVVDMMVKRNVENEKRREEERARKKRLERERMERAKAYEEPEWARAEEEEADEEGGSSGEEEDEERKEEKELYCVACGKKFKSEKQWENHEKSKKHKEKVAALKESFVEEEDEEEEEEENEDAEATGVEEDRAEEIGERMRDDLEIKEDEKEQIEDGGEMSEEERFFDVDESNKEVGTKEMEGPSHNDDEDDKLNEMSVLEAMLSGRKNRRKMAAMQELRASSKVDAQNGEEEFMEYDSRKSTRKNRGAKKERSRKNNGEDADTGNSKANDQSGDRTNGDDDAVVDGSACKFPQKDESEAIGGNEVAKNQALNQSSDRKRTGKKDPITKSNNAPKGRKSKASAKNSDNLCETCGQEFDSRNKLHKHLGETGHASLKYRR